MRWYSREHRAHPALPSLQPRYPSSMHWLRRGPRSRRWWQPSRRRQNGDARLGGGRPGRRQLRYQRMSVRQMPIPPPLPPRLFDELNPSPRLLMGPGPVNVDPRVLRAMSMPLLGQFDPEFTAYMNETMVLYRQLFQTGNRTFLVDGTARAGIEALLVSVLEPGDRVLVPIFGRFGHLLAEIAARCGADIRIIETEWGSVFPPERIE